MKIGIFDSGLGGLIVTRAIRKMMPEYDYIYLGDTKRVPYGNRSHQAVFEFTRRGIDYLFKKENCGLVIVACNTASARALRKIQQEYLPELNRTLDPLALRALLLRRGRKLESSSLTRKGLGRVFHRNVLGVLVPTAEECAKYRRVGIIGTIGTITSGTFPKEIKKILALRSLGGGGNKQIKVFQNPAPALVPLAEEGEKKLAVPFLEKYLKPLLIKRPEAIALGCTHYPFFKKEIRKIIKNSREPFLRKVVVLSQDEFIPRKLKDYLLRHPEIEKKLSQKRAARIFVTDLTQNVSKLTQAWFGPKTKPKLVRL